MLHVYNFPKTLENIIISKAVSLSAHLTGKGRQNLQSTTSDLSPLALNLTKLIPVSDPVKWQNM